MRYLKRDYREYLMHLNHFAERVGRNYWAIRDHVVAVIHILIRDRRLRQELERVRVLLAEAFGDRETVHIVGRATL